MADLFWIPDSEKLNNTQGSRNKQYSWCYEYFVTVGLNFKIPHIWTMSQAIQGIAGWPSSAEE